MNQLRRVAFKSRNFIRFYSSDLFEPPYLEALKPKIPLYDTLNIQMRGYDYPILENYQKLVHNIVKNMELDVEDSWAVPAQDLNISTYKPNSEIINSQYKLSMYNRTVQITDIPTTQLPILIRAIEASVPAGVSVDIVQHEEYHEEERYVPDQELLTLKQELDDMGGPRKVK